eukprot:6677293-Prymnesium_polylepis.1
MCIRDRRESIGSGASGSVWQLGRHALTLACPCRSLGRGVAVVAAPAEEPWSVEYRACGAAAAPAGRQFLLCRAGPRARGRVQIETLRVCGVCREAPVVRVYILVASRGVGSRRHTDRDMRAIQRCRQNGHYATVPTLTHTIGEDMVPVARS